MEGEALNLSLEMAEGQERTKDPRGWVQLSETIGYFEKLKLSDRVYKGISLDSSQTPHEIALKFVTPNEVHCRAQVPTHPNIMYASALGTDRDPNNAIVMELCDGTTLAQYVENRRRNNTPLNAEEAMALTVQLVDGMCHLHANDMVHGNLTPDHVLFSQDRQHIIITSYGLGGNIATQSPEEVLRNGYLAPEMYTSRQATTLSDVYMLGLTIFYIWSNGSHPFGDDESQWGQRILNGSGMDLSRALANFENEEFGRYMFESILHPVPARRPTMLQIREALTSRETPSGPDRSEVALTDQATTGPTGEVRPPSQTRTTGDNDNPTTSTIAATGGAGANMGRGIETGSQDVKILNAEFVTIVKEETTSKSRDRGYIQVRQDIRYLWREKLSKYGKVFKGELLVDGTWQPIAVKILDFDQECLREAEILRKLNPHPHVVHMRSYGVFERETEQLIFIAMELYGSKTLHEFMTEQIRENKAFDPEWAFRISMQLLEGMLHIHGQNVMHRDLKPHNILAKDDLIKIADYGLSKQMRPGQSVTKLSVYRVGTDGYRAPETYNSDEISFKADIFSLGLTFYFIWSKGRHPYGEDPDYWNGYIKENRTKDLSRLLMDWDKRMKAYDLLRWMLRFAPRERPSIQEVKDHELFSGSLRCPYPEDTFSGPFTGHSASPSQTQSRGQQEEPPRRRRRARQ